MRHSLRALITAMTTVATILSAYALDTNRYATSSVLSSGKWRKVSVSTSGMHFISADQLRKWGYSDPMTVSLYGYGAAVQPDLLSASTYIDDLPEVKCERSPQGIYFYGVGSQIISYDDNRVTSSLNYYTSRGYYFIGERGAAPAEIETEGRYYNGGGVSTSTAIVSYEEDAVNYGNTGRQFFGDDFRFNRQREYKFKLPRRTSDVKVWISCRVAVKSVGNSVFTLSCNGKNVGSVTLAPVERNSFGTSGEIRVEIDEPAEELTLGLTFMSTGTVSAANLDAIDINYESIIAVDKEPVTFGSTDTSVELVGATADTRVWDITDPLRPVAMNHNAIDGKNAHGWINDYTGHRRYIAWEPTQLQTDVQDEGAIVNSNLHALEPVDMLVITTEELKKEAERFAELHRKTDAMNVAVVTQQSAFNEFSSGVPEPGAFRRLAKMLYDRGTAHGKRLEYVVLFGRTTFDNRGVTSGGAVMRSSAMPSWQSQESLHENVSYTTDDFIAFLEDGSGLRPGAERYCVAVGRIPARDAAEARAFIEKLEKYMNGTSGDWINRVIVTADDGDNGIHIIQSDEMIDAMCSEVAGRDMVYDKVYIDAYPLVGGVCEQGRTRLHRLLDAGARWWTYTGHANKYYLSSQGIMTLNDINSMTNKYLPVFFGATCYFMQWDGTEQTGAEKMFFRPGAGVIAAITATRPVFISENSMLSRIFGREMFSTDNQGHQQSLGKMLQNAKNALASPAGTSDINKLKYALMGDPALNVTTANARIVVTHINGIPVESTDTADIVMRGGENVLIEGMIIDLNGDINKDFNGLATITLYDAEHSTVSIGRNIDGTTGSAQVFEEHGERLYIGCDSIVCGKFSTTIPVPADLADNYRHAMLSLTATGKNSTAAGTFHDFYVYGSDPDANTDTIPPVIEKFYINHPTFVTGDKVNASPMVFATVRDNVGLNISSAGIGRAMVLRLDGATSFTNLSDYYSPNAGDNASGTIAFPLNELAEGNHTLTLRICDTAGNATEATIDFCVDPDADPNIYKVYTDANPASIEANFFVSHNRPDEIMTVTIEVYNLLGNLVWSETVTDRSEMFTSAPITWNLHNIAGQRVTRGIYIYRARIAVDGKTQLSKGERIAVTGN